MAKPSAYDLLTVIHNEVKDLRAELIDSHDKNEARIVELEKFQYNLMGKIGMGVLLVGGAVTFVMNLIFTWFKDKLN